MQHQGHGIQDQQKQAYEYGSMKYWRAWGSWFSWGSPVGLGLFFLAAAGTVWILGKTFHW